MDGSSHTQPSGRNQRSRSNSKLYISCQKRSVQGRYEGLCGNDLIENSISNLYENQNHESFIDVITAVCFRIINDGQGWVPFVTVSGEMFLNLDVRTLQEGDKLTLDQEVRLHMDTVAAEDGIEWLYIFTNEEESHKKPVPNVVMEIPIRQNMEGEA